LNNDNPEDAPPGVTMWCGPYFVKNHVVTNEKVKTHTLFCS
jgi:hypothetical protein